MRVLVTGNKGYIGRVLTGVLAADGHEVVGIDAGWFANCKFDYPLPEVPGRQLDLRDLGVRDFEGFDAVVHLAAICNDPLGNLNADLTNEINFVASLRCARLAKKAGVSRFLFSSSCSLYGGGGSGAVDETSEQEPITAYGHSKKALEQALLQLADESFCTVSLRNATAYGASPALRMDLVLNEFIADAYTTGRVVVKSDGTPWRPMVHIEDIAHAFVAALNAPASRVCGEAVNVGGDAENYQVRDLARIACQEVPGAEVDYASGGGPDKRNYRVNFAKIGRLLPDFRLRWTARTGAAQLHEAYRRAGLTKEMISGPQFRRLHHIQRLIDSKQLDNSLQWRFADRTAMAA
ncbi:MAG: NAD-dependent epimerase/dehydratase [Bryobacterales bacterium]|jgi:nucleoside-diphosphate-sugar epimerase|nr:NAD-dependent epimerase/dehydratase [Bryobacterales bacterium]